MAIAGCSPENCGIEFPSHPQLMLVKPGLTTLWYWYVMDLVTAGLEPQFAQIFCSSSLRGRTNDYYQ